jgi:uncharacterized protein YyaL (SSP411 family)
MTTHTNRLAKETSPYLLQHAHNPVDWYPWGEEAFQKAREEDKPIVLSVGYSACHWCHVMEHESFENEEIARLMNELFVSIKVDREERPDVDQIYMQAVQSITGHGGWPMTVFLTPDGVPFYGGTYFPPVDRHGLPAFPRLLEGVAHSYRNRRDEIVESGQRLVEQLRASERLRGSSELLTTDILHAAFQGLSTQFESRHGGFGRAPKFPQPMLLDFCLRYAWRTGFPHAMEMVTLTLTRMARGGMYDQLGGGFHRYSVDDVWLVPHFEKMLYDNAQLARLYLDAWVATGNAEYRRVAEETLDYVLREMTHPEGGFFSAQDADSEGEEGKFFLWSADEVQRVLGDGERSRVALAYWDFDPGPNFEGKNILHVPREPSEVASELGLSVEVMMGHLTEARGCLFKEREKRIRPGRDDKVLSAWNGLMLRAFAEAARRLGRTDYRSAAVKNAEFLLAHLRRDGRLLRTWKDGEAKLQGYLEDYAMIGDGLLALYETSFDRRWLDEAKHLADEILRLFWDDQVEGFYDTGSDHESLVIRPRNLFDNAVPCGSSVAADLLLRLAALLGEERYERHAVLAIRHVADLMIRYASGFGRWLAALDFHLGPAAEIALAWPKAGDDKGREALISEIVTRYLPNRLVLAGEEGDPLLSKLPLFSGKTAQNGKATAYVCRHFACNAPTPDPQELAQQLDALK